MFNWRRFIRAASMGLAALLLLAGAAHAAPISEDTARLVARNFIANHIAQHGSWNGTAAADIQSVELVRHQKTPVAYNVSVRPSGHILVAYDDDFSPVLLYSDTSSFDPARANEADAVESWIIPEIYAVHQDMQSRLRDYLAANPDAPVVQYRNQSRSAKAWKFFNRQPTDFSPLPRAGKSKSGSSADYATLDAAVVGPLLSTTWNQGSPKTAPFTYNLYTPADTGCSHAYTGCVATATAQIMKYWNWPDIGTGSHSYSWVPPSGASYQTLSANFGHAYNWSSMPASLSSSSSSAEIDAVARLMSDVGIANEMVYGCDGSGAWADYSASYVLPTYFKYQNTVQTISRTSYTAPAFFAALKAEFDAVPPRPVLYRMDATSGGGHAVVADGYQTGTTDMVHINLGWGGSYNGYYDISNNWSTGSLTWSATSQAAYTHIQPTSTTPCSYSVSPSTQSASASGLFGTVSVTAGSSCAWTASSNVSWIGIISGSSGSGSGTVAFSVAANTGSSARVGMLTIGGQTVTVTQAGASCSYALTPTSLSVGSGASTSSASVTTGASCNWSASSNASWLSVTSGASSSGSGTTAFSVAANTVSASRTGTLTIAGQTLSVTQAGAGCSYTITPTSQSIAADASNGMVAVSAGYACTWSASSNASWISITSGSTGRGEGSVTYSASANTSTSSRTGTLSIAGQTFTVTQAGNNSSAVNFLNPGFENGQVNWTESGLYSIITNDATLSHSGNWVSWLGGYDGASDSLYQSVTIPASATTANIRYWYRIYTDETTTSTAYDQLTVTIENAATSAVLATQTLSNLNAGSGWAQSTPLDVSAYVGQTIRLRFRATTDTFLATSFFIDDVALTTTASSSYTSIAEKLYVSYFGRPADPAGLANMEAQFAASGAPTTAQAFVDAYSTNANVKAVIDNFGNSQESRNLYGTGSTASFVTAIFTYVLNRAPQSAGLTFWTNAIDSGSMSRGQAAMYILAGAENNPSSQGLIDAARLANVVTISTNFTHAIDTPAEVAGYAGAIAAGKARAMLATVTNTTDPVAFQATVDATLAAIVGGY